MSKKAIILIVVAVIVVAVAIVSYMFVNSDYKTYVNKSEGYKFSMLKSDCVTQQDGTTYVYGSVAGETCASLLAGVDWASVMISSSKYDKSIDDYKSELAIKYDYVFEKITVNGLEGYKASPSCFFDSNEGICEGWYSYFLKDNVAGRVFSITPARVPQRIEQLVLSSFQAL